LSWTFLLLAALAAALIELGDAYAMVNALSIGLHAAVIVIATLATLLLWQQLSTQNENS
jgi:predicted membrane metal-binding protein